MCIHSQLFLMQCQHQMDQEPTTPNETGRLEEITTFHDQITPNYADTSVSTADQLQKRKGWC